MARSRENLLLRACFGAIAAIALTGLGRHLGACWYQDGEQEASLVSPTAWSEAVGHPLFLSPQFRPIVVQGRSVFVANTAADTVDVIDAESREVIARISVGIDPVCLAVRPDGKELWVANHVSDSINVIDLTSDRPTYLQVIATIQDFSRQGETRFDEPVGIAFASNEKAYVALSSENEIAVIDTQERKISRRLKIPAQDPRAILVSDEKLLVLPFESNNRTQLSGGSRQDIDGELVTFDIWEHSIANNNVLSLGHKLDIVKHPEVPDHDLFVFDTKTDRLIETVDSLGTLLYGLAVDSRGGIWVAQTDARNDVNGRAGTKQHGLKELENRPFFNRVTRVTWDDHSHKVEIVDLEPLPPSLPSEGQRFATPYAIEMLRGDAALVATASGSDLLFTLDPHSGEVLGQVQVGGIPQGIALDYQLDQEPQAWVLNAGDNSVALVNLKQLDHPVLVATVPLEDPTPPLIKQGRLAFSTARASSSGTFSCASCHPDGHTDQLLWVLQTPIVTGGEQIMPRSTMPVRGLRDTEPFHWDGIPGDPYGGINSASVHASVEPTSDREDPESSVRHLIDGALATTMRHLDDEQVNDRGQLGRLSDEERKAMSAFLLSVPFPPAPKRPFANVPTPKAFEGFRLFHVDGDLDPAKFRPNVCGDCHRMPFLVSTNTPGSGMDAPTWRGAADRWLILPQGRLNVVELDFFADVARRGLDEEQIWNLSWGRRNRFDSVWRMVVEGSTGFPGQFARQVTLSCETIDLPESEILLDALEQGAREDAIRLKANGVRFEEGPIALQLEYLSVGGNWIYRDRSNAASVWTRESLMSNVRAANLVLTMTAHMGRAAQADHAQPALWSEGPIEQQRGRQVFPILFPESRQMTLGARHVDRQASVFVDGRKVAGEVVILNDERARIELVTTPAEGLHLLQVQNPQGLFSNEFLFHVTPSESQAKVLRETLDEPHSMVGALRRILEDGSDIHARRDDGATPLNQAAFWGERDLVEKFLDRGADPSSTNADGNSALHLAAFMGHQEMVKLLLERGASWSARNDKGETPLDVVSGAWSPELSGFYLAIGRATGMRIQSRRIREAREQIAEQLRDWAQEHP